MPQVAFVSPGTFLKTYLVRVYLMILIKAIGKILPWKLGSKRQIHFWGNPRLFLGFMPEVKIDLKDYRSMTYLLFHMAWDRNYWKYSRTQVSKPSEKLYMDEALVQSLVEEGLNVCHSQKRCFNILSPCFVKKKCFDPWVGVSSNFFILCYRVFTEPPWAEILSPLTGVKVSYEVGLKLTQGLGCPCSIKCLL